ncbi:MAG: hypothetical protein QW067_11650 [Thermofilaceae archaeon]
MKTDVVAVLVGFAAGVTFHHAALFVVGVLAVLYYATAVSLSTYRPRVFKVLSLVELSAGVLLGFSLVALLLELVTYLGLSLSFLV